MKTNTHTWRQKAAMILMTVCSILPLTSCDWFHEDLDGCDTDSHLRVKVIYEMNMEYDASANKFEDLFGDSVYSVNLFAFDKDGNYVYGRTQSADAIKAQGGYMDIDDMPAGEYNLLVWAEGKPNASDSYTYGYTANGQTINNYNVTVNSNVTGQQLTSLFHGYTLNADLNAKAGETKETTVELTKNTNTWHIFLRYASGKDLDLSRFDFKISDDNGYLSYDNSLATSNITYTPYSTDDIKVEVGNESFSGAAAHITVNRMMEQDNNMTLTVTDKVTGETVIKGEPIVQYAKMQQEKEIYPSISTTVWNNMTSQQYLDREDNYVITFDLDDGNRWLDDHLYVLSWRVVRQTIDF